MGVTFGVIDPTAKLAEFAALGTVFRRNNPDGTACTPERLLGTSVPVDLTQELDGIKLLDITGSPVTEAVGLIGISVDDKKFIIEPDFYEAVDLEAVTPSVIVDALNTAIQADDVLELEVEAEVLASGAVNIKAIKPTTKSVQIFGYLAGALGFGGGEAFNSLGSFYRNYVTGDDTITCTRADQRTDNQDIDQMGGGKNTLTRITIAGKRTGVQYAVNVKPRDKILRQMFEGGKLSLQSVESGKPHKYYPPVDDEAVGARGLLEVFRLAPLYPANRESKEGQEVGVVVEHVFSGMGIPQDPSTGALTLSSFNYLIDAGVYIDENGKEHAQPEEIEYSSNLWLTDKFIPTLKNEWTMTDLYGDD